MGAEPTPIAWGEVYSALQLGTIDAAEAQPTAIKGAKLYEVIKHVTKTGHIQLVTALVRTATALADAGDHRGHFLFAAGRLSLAAFARQLSAMAHGLSLVLRSA